MRMWPQTIMGRTLTVLLMGIVLTVMIAFAYQFMERRMLLSTIGGWHGAERISDIITKIEVAQPIDRATLARSFETPGFRAAWTRETSLAPMGLDWQGRQVRRALEEFLGDIAQDGLRIEMTSYRNASRAVPHTRMLEWRKRLEMKGHSKTMDRMMQSHGAPTMTPRALLERDLDRPVLLISYRLTDGSWLTFLTPPAPVRPVWNTHFFLPSILSLLMVIAISVWAVRRSTKPLNRFALAAGRLGLDVNAPPMVEDGPREVRRAATAFNRMQRRLQAFCQRPNAYAGGDQPRFAHPYHAIEVACGIYRRRRTAPKNAWRFGRNGSHDLGDLEVRARRCHRRTEQGAGSCRIGQRIVRRRPAGGR